MKPTTITVVAELDWITAVTRVPARIATTPFREKNWRIFFIFSPAILNSPSPMGFMPKTKNASPPIAEIITDSRSSPSTRTWLERRYSPDFGSATSTPILYSPVSFPTRTCVEATPRASVTTSELSTFAEFRPPGPESTEK